MKPLKILTIFGTRPEAIKLAPVLKEAARYPDQIVSRICVTAQHREMLDQVMDIFDVQPDYDLDLMRRRQSSPQIAASIMRELEPILREEKPDWVLVQGDTTTVAAAALTAFYCRIKIGHVEAGLRTHNRWHPFPEEINRKVAGVVADLHFAPTEGSRKNLLAEGVSDDAILVTGNPVIDALQWVSEQPAAVATQEIIDQLNLGDEKLILVTAHRQENFGEPMQQIAAAIREIASRYPDSVRVVFPVHLNPRVREVVEPALADVSNISLIEPLDYMSFIHLLKRSTLILTDSGGVQEEAPGLGKPVLVLREVTERPEAVEANTVKIVGCDQQRIIDETCHLLDDSAAYDEMAQAVNPYGDGHAAERIIRALLNARAVVETANAE